jgi:hypothetical protein
MLFAPVDTRPLTALPPSREVRAYRRGRGTVAGPPVRVLPCFGGVGYTIAFVVSGAAAIALGVLHAEPRAVLLSGLVSAATAVGAALCARATRARTCVGEYRLAAFAARNGLVYERYATSPTVDGLRFSDTPGQSLRRFSGRLSGMQVEIGNYRHATGAVSGYVIAGGRVEAAPPFDFSSPAEWHRAWRLLPEAASAVAARR